MEKPDLKTVIEMSKKVNKLKLIDEKIDVKLPYDGLIEDYMTVVIAIHDKGLYSKLSDEIIDVYSAIVEYYDDTQKQGSVLDDNGFDREALEDQLSEMDFEQIEDFIAENDLFFEEDLTEDDFDNDPADVIEMIVDKMEEKISDDNGSDDERSELEVKLNEMAFKDFKAFIKDDDNLTEYLGGLPKLKEFKDNKAELIEKILNFKFPEDDGSADEDDDNSGKIEALTKELSQMKFVEIKRYLKDNELTEIFGGQTIKAAEWKNDDKKAEIIEKIIKALFNKTDDAQEPFDREALQEKLMALDSDELAEYIEENNLSDEVSEVDVDTFEDEQEDIVEEILDIMEMRNVELDDDSQGSISESPLVKELSKMDWKEFSNYVKKAKIKDKISKFKKSDFEKLKPQLIKEVVSLADAKPKAEEKTEASAKKKDSAKKAPPVVRKTGKSYQEVIARVIRDSKKPLTRAQIIAEAEKEREALGEKTTSCDNYTNIVIAAAMELGVLDFDEKKQTYKLKK